MLVVLVFVAILAIYSVGVSPAVFGGDAGDIILSYFTGGIAHPPGYPLNTLFGFILTRVFPGSTFAFKANFVAAIYQAATIALVYLLIKNLIKNAWVSLSAAFTLGLSPLFWLYAHVAEVFQLTLFLIAASVLFLFKWFLSNQAKRESKYLYLSVFLFGLAVFHHQIPIFLLPAYVYIVSKKRAILSLRVFFSLVLAFFLGIVPYLYIILVEFLKILTNWGDTSTLAGVWRLISRGDYGTFVASPELLGVSIFERLTHVWWYLNTTRADFTYLGLFFALVGIIWLFLRKRDWFWFLALAWFFSGPFFVAYAAFPPAEAFLRGISERFYLNSYLFLAIFIGMGMYTLFGLGVFFLNIFFNNKNLLGLLVGGTFLLFPLTLFVVNWPKADLSDFGMGEVLALDILGSAQPAGMLLLQGDTATFAVQYSYYVDRVNPQLALVMSGRMRHPSYRQKLALEYPGLRYPDKFTSDDVSFEDAVVKFIENNFESTPVYSLEKLPLPDEYVWIQEGLVLRLYKKDREPSSATVAATIDKKMKNLFFEGELDKKRYLNFFEEHIRGIYSRFYTRNGLELARRDQIDMALPLLLAAIEIEPTNREALFSLGVIYLDRKNCDGAAVAFAQAVEIDDDYWQAWDGLGRVYETCLEDKNRAGQYYQKSRQIRERLFDEPI